MSPRRLLYQMCTHFAKPSFGVIVERKYAPPKVIVLVIVAVVEIKNPTGLQNMTLMALTRPCTAHHSRQSKIIHGHVSLVPVRFTCGQMFCTASNGMAQRTNLSTEDATLAQVEQGLLEPKSGQVQ
jgi:hypothetical protein